MKIEITVEEGLGGDVAIKFKTTPNLAVQPSERELRYCAAIKEHLQAVGPTIAASLGSDKVEHGHGKMPEGMFKPRGSHGIKVKMNDDGGIDPETKRLLIEYAQHKDCCEACERAYKTHAPAEHCVTGLALLGEIGQRPDVSEA